MWPPLCSSEPGRSRLPLGKRWETGNREGNQRCPPRGWARTDPSAHLPEGAPWGGSPSRQPPAHQARSTPSALGTLCSVKRDEEERQGWGSQLHGWGSPGLQKQSPPNLSNNTFSNPSVEVAVLIDTIRNPLRAPWPPTFPSALRLSQLVGGWSKCLFAEHTALFCCLCGNMSLDPF